MPIPKTTCPTWDKLRPISLTDHFSKLAEFFVMSWVMEDIEPRIDTNQFGNRKNRSTTHYLVKLLHELYEHSDKQRSLCRVVVTDFSKAFDRVDHNIIIPKLLDMGTRPEIIPWLCSFLSNRSQCVRYQNITSNWKTLQGGVPQGTLVGPGSFLVLNNDAALSEDQRVCALKYVDDITLVEKSNLNQQSLLQQHLTNFESWSDTNNMSLNPSKCMAMNVCFSTSPVTPDPLVLCNQILAEVDVVKVLGVHISSDLKWNVHINNVIKRAAGRLFMLTTLKRFHLPLQDLITIYIGFIRPLLEYVVPVWHSSLSNEQTSALERVQKRALRIILRQRYISYTDALQTCSLESLADRREKICKDFATKLLSDPFFRDWLPKARSSTHGRNLRNAHKLTTQRSRTKRFYNSAIPYLTRLLNS